MKIFLTLKKENKLKNDSKGFKLKNIFLIFCLLFVIAAVQVRPVHAQLAAVTPLSDALKAADTIWGKIQVLGKYLWTKAGSIAFQRTLQTALNKIAFDTANYIGSGGSGQKPLFITKDWGAYLQDVGDQAAGQFVESFVNNMNNPPDEDCNKTLDNCINKCWDQQSPTDGLTPEARAELLSKCTLNCRTNNTACSTAQTSGQNTLNKMNATPSFNVCSPSSLTAKVKIGLGLVDINQPQGPDCSASKMVSNWSTDLNQKLQDLQDPNYLSKLSSIFDPRSNDLGISVLAKSDLSKKAIVDKNTANTKLTANKGWLNVSTIAGGSAAAPGTPERQLQEAKNVQTGNIGKITGDVLVDSANIFLNQLAMSAFNKLMQDLGKPKSNSVNDSVGSNGYSNDPNSGGGAAALNEITTKLLKPSFGTQTDYDILSSLTICLDPKNPAPDNCAIDSQFMQAVSEKKTVSEALDSGYLHGDWQLTNSTSGDAYNSSYSLRDILILVKYRILPIGWVEANKLINDQSAPHNATLNDLVSCFDPYDKYTKFSSGFDKTDTDWCKGLIDPNWVLSTPLNYCQKSGYGAQILNMTVMPGTPGGTGYEATPSSISITRADAYCADNQTCIKEKADGSCDAYGYCNGETRTWKFNTDSCDPINNTCQSFAGSDGKDVSYLQNTLDYGICNSSNAGCRQYSLSGVYATSTGTISWNQNQSLYLNNNLNTCNIQDNGCTELMRVKPTWGNNLVMNSDFVNDRVGDSSTGATLNDWPLYSANNNIKASIVDSSQEPGGFYGKALKIEINKNSIGGIVSSLAKSLLPDNLQVIQNQAYTLSADVYIVGGGNAGTIVSLTTSNDASYLKTTSVLDSWQHLTITRPANTSYSEPSFGIVGQNTTSSGVFYIKNIKFEMSAWDTGYSSYSETPTGSSKIYEKLLPPYLESTCYTSVSGVNKDYSLKTNAPAVCSNYARRCNLAEVGCDSYKNSTDNFTVAAKVSMTDYCPAACLGYDVYISKGSYFNSPTKENLIPKTATTCSAAAVGCNEFTNLDALTQGGETKEYYSSLKQCIKPSATQCSSFYAWQGEAGGYQLQAYSLEKDANGLPAVTSDDSAQCNAAIYNLPVSDPAFNSDCKAFYNAGGKVSYHLTSRTITCSDNCHTYRMTDKNIDASVTQANCTGADKHWDGDATTGSCNVCLNGGTWDANSGACFYNAIPGEGQTCQASENRCQEYNGNTGSNVRLIASYDFENGLGDWTSTCSSNSSISISTISNNKDGHSLLSSASGCTNASAQLDVSGYVKTGAAYTLKFLGLASVDTNLQIYFVNKDTGVVSDNFNTVKVKGGNNWNIYQTNLASLNQAIGTNEKLVIVGAANVYLDNFILSEITDRYYLIKNSSQIPNACYYDALNNYRGADYNLGCANYTDRNGQGNNLHQFTNLCSVSAVGCEQVIDTKNYSPYGLGFWEDGIATSTCSAGDPNCVIVPGDSAIYAVYDANKQCSAASQGCSLLGQGQGGQNLVAWSDTFKANNPNQYSNILCNQASVGCEAWTSKIDNTTSYFKNPGSNVCVYRASQDPTKTEKDWYKIPAKRCDLNNDKQISGSSEQGSPICVNDSDCGTNKCVLDNTDYKCSYSVFETIGLGGGDGQVKVPDSNAGLCSPVAAGCTEYIDPVTPFNPNLVKNSGFVTTDGIQDGWGTTSTGWPTTPSQNQQVVPLEQYKLYSFNVIPSDTSNTTGVNTTGVNLVFKDASEDPVATSSVRQLSNNNFSGPLLTLAAATSINTPVTFNSASSTMALLTGGAAGRVIEIKELAVNYQLQTNVDKTSCNGQAQFDNGCILFNERTINGAAGYANLSFDAYQTNSTSTTNSVSPILCSASISGLCTANQVIKVSPARACSSWLDCTSYVQDPITNEKTCYAYGQCDRLNSQNECEHFASNVESGVLKTAVDNNASGYAIWDAYNLSQMKIIGKEIVGAHFDFEKGVLPARCVSPITTPCLIDNPDVASFATTYPAQGKAYLAVSTDKSYVIANLESAGQSDYYINYLVNTSKSIGSKAAVTITPYGSNNSTGTPIVFYSPANLDWTRVVNKFSLTNAQKISITLGFEAIASSSGSIYFDDVSIDPVLQTGPVTEANPNPYVSPECRLYPTGESLTCIDKNTNTVKPGLKGYCLQHDPANSKVCLVWYPLDNISPLAITASGYQGKFPLNYCAEANGNFDLLEKRMATWVDQDRKGGKKIDLAGNGKYTFSNGNTGPFICYKFDGVEHKYYNENNPANGYVVKTYPKANKSYCYNSDDYDLWISYRHCTTCDNYYKLICVPRKNNLFSAFQTNLSEKDNNYEPIENWEYCEKNTSADNDSNNTFTNGYGIYNGLSGQNITSEVTGTSHWVGEATNMDPPIAVYDYDNKPASEAALKYPYATSTMESTQIFNFTCNSFVQTVTDNNINRAWTDRVSRASDDTPEFFKLNPYNLNNNLNKYGQSRSDAPFGSAASANDNLFTTGRVVFNIPSTDPGTNIAGRPYGCINGINNSVNTIGCNLIGFCSNNANVYCLTTDHSGFTNSAGVTYNLSNNTCGIGNTCTPLWGQDQMINVSGNINNPYKNILTNIFLKGDIYKFTGTGYSIDGNDSYNNSNTPTTTATTIPHCSNNTRTPDYKFCAVWPSLSNVKLYFGDNATPFAENFSSSKLLPITKGWYRLEFNSFVDAEQKPLSNVVINWGDGYEQSIANQDNRSATSSPHVFYHNYNQNHVNTPISIKVQVFDNWGFFASN